MESRNAFPRQVLAAAAASGVDIATVGRHLPILARCVPANDTPVLIAHAGRPADRTNYLLVLTARRLVVTAESRVLRRRRLHLNADPRHLLDVLWTSEPTIGGLTLSASTIYGVREHFWVRTPEPDAVAAKLAEVFQPAPTRVRIAALLAA